jgi:hypothetical protein
MVEIEGKEASRRVVIAMKWEEPPEAITAVKLTFNANGETTVVNPSGV